MSESQRRKNYLKAYWLSDKGKMSQKRYRQSKRGKAAQKRYKQSEKGKANHRKTNIRHFALYPERLKARTVVNNAVKRGKLLRPNTLRCHYCEKQAEQYHHWRGYKQSLDVIPICRECHQKHKRKIA